MNRIAILVNPYSWAMQIALIQDFFYIVNSLLRTELTQHYQVELISQEKGEICLASGQKIWVEHDFKNPPDFDVLMIVGIDGQKIASQHTQKNDVSTWLKTYVMMQKPIICLTTACYFVASIDDVQNELLTTHWAFLNTLQRLFPKGKFTAQCDYVANEYLMTTSNLQGCFQALLLWVTRSHGEHFAQYCASYLLIHLEQYIPPFLPKYHHHQDELVKRAQYILEQQYMQPVLISGLAKQLEVHERTLARRFKAMTSVSINEYLQQVRLKQAKALLSKSSNTVQQISFMVGYDNVSFFIRLFKKYYGETPMVWKSQNMK